MNSDDILSIFFVECEESLEAAEHGLDACKAQSHDSETINAIFRAVHSIKGGAGAFGYVALQSFTHCFETLLADVREGTVALEPELVETLLLALDCLRDHVEAARSGMPAPDDVAIMESLTNASLAKLAADVTQPDAPAESAMADLDALLDDMLAAPSPRPATSPPRAADGWQVHLRPHDGALANGNEPLLWLRSLADLGGQALACDYTALPALDEYDAEQAYLGWTFLMPASATQEAVREIFDFVGEDCSLAFGEEEAIPRSFRRPGSRATSNANAQARGQTAPCTIGGRASRSSAAVRSSCNKPTSSTNGNVRATCAAIGPDRSCKARQADRRGRRAGHRAGHAYPATCQ